MDHDALHERLSAYVDGELDAAEAQAVEELLRDSDEARIVLRRLERATGLLRELPRHAAPPTIAEDVLARIERQALLDDPPDRGSLPRTRGRAWLWRLSMAAGVVLSVTAGMWALTSLRRDYHERQSSVAMGARESGAARSTREKARESDRETGSLAGRSESRKARRSLDSGTATSPPRSEADNAVAGGERALDEATIAIANQPVALTAKDEASEGVSGSRRASVEAARLRIEVTDARQRDLIVDQLSKQLRAANVTPETELADGAGSGSTARRAPSAHFREGRRIAQDDRHAEARSMLVHAPPEVISRVTEEAVRLNPSSRIQLEAGGSQYEGLAATQSQLLALAGSPGQSRSNGSRRMRVGTSGRGEADAKRSQPTRKRAGIREDHSDDSSSSLWSAFGLDPGILDALMPRERAESEDSASGVASGPRPPLSPTSPVEFKTDSDLIGPPESRTREQGEQALAEVAPDESLVARRIRELDAASKEKNAAAREETVNAGDRKPYDRADSSKSAGALPGSAGPSPGARDNSGSSDTVNTDTLESDEWPAEATTIDVIIEIVPVAPATIDPASVPSLSPSFTPDASPKPASKPHGTS